MPWGDNRSFIKQVLQIPFFAESEAESYSLLHHPSRGAVCELQLLDVMQGGGIDEAKIASLVNVCAMDNGELHALLGILVAEEHNARRGTLDLLYKAAEHLGPFKAVQPNAEPQFCTWVTQIKLQEAAGCQNFPITGTQLCLNSKCKSYEGEHSSTGMELSLAIMLVACKMP